jgi:hypothetical protein
MPEKVFLGTAWESGTPYSYPNIHAILHFESAYSGVLTKLGLYSRSSGDAKLNLYEIYGGSATNLLYADDTGMSCIADQMNYLDISSAKVEVIAGTKYGIGAITGTPDVVSTNAQSGARSYKTGLNYSTFTAPDPVSGYTDQSPISNVWSLVAYGYEPPTIISSDSSIIQDGQVGITLTGTDFMGSGATIELCDSLIYSSATKASQTVTGQTDTTIEFTAARGDLTGQGIHYLFITTSLGQRNTVGYPISLMGYDYGRNIPQQGDVWIFDDTDGGNIEVTNGFVTMTKFVESAVYLCWFGGNFRDDGSQSTEKLQWWGNEDEPVFRQYRGRLQSVIMGSPLTSAQLVKIENAAVYDLKNGLPNNLVSEVSVSVSASTPKRVDLTANIVTKSGTPYEVNVGVDL